MREGGPGGGGGSESGPVAVQLSVEYLEANYETAEVAAVAAAAGQQLQKEKEAGGPSPKAPSPHDYLTVLVISLLTVCFIILVMGRLGVKMRFARPKV